MLTNPNVHLGITILLLSFKPPFPNVIKIFNVTVINKTVGLSQNPQTLKSSANESKVSNGTQSICVTPNFYYFRPNSNKYVLSLLFLSSVRVRIRKAIKIIGFNKLLLVFLSLFLEVKSDKDLFISTLIRVIIFLKKTNSEIELKPLKKQIIGLYQLSISYNSSCHDPVARVRCLYGYVAVYNGPLRKAQSNPKGNREGYAQN